MAKPGPHGKDKQRCVAYPRSAEIRHQIDRLTRPVSGRLRTSALDCAHRMSSFDGSAAAVSCEAPDAGKLDEAIFGTALSAPAGKFRVTPAIPNAKIDAVPRINLRIFSPYVMLLLSG